MTKKRGLGRDLQALLGKKEAALEKTELPADSKRDIRKDKSETSSQEVSAPADGELRELPIEFIQPGKYQPRTGMRQDALQELAESIKVQGLMQPIVVRPISSIKFEIIAGERRWRAAQLAGLHKVPTLIRDVPDSSAIAMALIENIQRENLNVIDEAMALKRLQDEFKLTQQEVAQSVGKSRAAVANLLRLINLPSQIRRMLEEGKLEMGHARALLTLESSGQTAIAIEVAKKGLTVRQTELLARQYGNKPTKSRASEISPDIQNLQNDLSERLGTEVTVEDKKGKGRLVIKYGTLDQLDGILNKIK
jgi:ParB family chromosome partitioning protein